MFRKRTRKVYRGRLRFKDFAWQLVALFVGGLLVITVSLPGLIGSESAASVTILFFPIGYLAILGVLAMVALLFVVRVYRLKYFRQLVGYRARRESARSTAN